MSEMTVCPKCGSGVELDPSPGPGESLRIVCEVCEHVFWFEGPDDDDE